jgi:hypothetical protein
MIDQDNRNVFMSTNLANLKEYYNLQTSFTYFRVGYSTLMQLFGRSLK